MIIELKKLLQLILFTLLKINLILLWMKNCDVYDYLNYVGLLNNRVDE